MSPDKQKAFICESDFMKQHDSIGVKLFRFLKLLDINNIAIIIYLQDVWLFDIS